MTQSTDHKTARNRYPDEFREHALALALRIGVAKAASESGKKHLHSYGGTSVTAALPALLPSIKGGNYQNIIKISQLKCSMSSTGNCYDNACAESFFHSLKVELIHGERFTDRETLKSEVFNYIEVDYNQKRRHSTLDYVSPMVFERQVIS